jgi:O-antigen/teichoic acid export membrane protein
MAISRLLRSYPLHRATVAALSFGAAVIAARFLPPAQFSALMTAAFLAKFLQIANLGATAGYFVSRYSEQGPLAQCALGAERRFLGFYLAQMAGMGLIVLGVAAIWLPEYLVGACAFLLFAPLFVVEPVLRYRRNFSFSLAPEFLLALALLSVLAASVVGVSERMLPVVYLGTIGALAVGLIVLAMRRRIDELRGDPGDFGLRSYAQVVRLGGPVYLGSALFLVASSMDRLLLPLYGSDEQIGIYFLAQQLAVGSMIFVTAINFVNTVNLGEARQLKDQVDRSMVAKKLRLAALVALGSYSLLIAGVALLEYAFLPKSFDGLAVVVGVLGAGLACFYTSNAITPIVAYFRRQMPLTISMGCVAVALGANNAWVFWKGLGAVWLAAGSALALALHATFAIWFTFMILRQQGENGQSHVN